MDKIRNLAIRSSVLIVSLVICGAGTALFVNADLGNDPLTAFIQGLSFQLNCSYGTAMTAVNAVAIVFVFGLGRHLIHIGTVVSLLLGGPISNWLILSLARLLGPSPSLAVRITLLLAGTFCVAVGVGIYQAAQLGASPLDALNQIIAARTHIPLRYERMICDAVLLTFAFILGGKIYIGTVVSLLLVGPIMAYFMERFVKIINRWTSYSHNGTDR